MKDKTPYEPEARSVPARVLDLFSKNLHEVYTSGDLALKFQVRAEQFSEVLAPCVLHGLLVYAREVGDTVKTWRATAKLQAWAAARQGTAPQSARALAPPPGWVAVKTSKRGGNRVQLPALDPAALKTELNAVPPPAKRFSTAGVSKYEVVFSGLPLNACRRVPAAYHGTLVTAIRKRHKVGPERYLVRRISSAESGVYRTA